MCRTLPFAVLFASCVFLLGACGQASGGGPATEGSGERAESPWGNDAVVLADTTPELTVRNVYEYQLHGGPGMVLVQDTDLFRHDHADEILETFEVAEVDTMGERAAVFVRYSVGTKVFRDGHMLRRVDDRWALTGHRSYFSDYDEDEWSQDSVALFDKQLADWKDESPEFFE